MKKKDLLDNNDFKIKIDKIKKKIQEENMILAETKIEEFNLTEAISYVLNCILNIPSF